MNFFSYINVTTKGLLLVLLPLIFNLVFVGVLAQQLSSTAERFDKLQTSLKVVYALQRMTETLLRGVTLLSSYQTIDPAERKVAAAEIHDMFKRPGYFGDVELKNKEEFSELFADAETSRKMFVKFTAKTAITAMVGPSDLYTNKDRDEIVLCILTFQSLLDRIRVLGTRLDNDEPLELKRIFVQFLVLSASGFLASCAVSFLLAYVLTFDIVRRLNVISDNAYLVAARKKLPTPDQGTDEIAQLEQALFKTSEQLRSFEKKELVILNNTADVVCSLDKQLRFLAVGESAERIWGFAPEDLLGRSLLTLLTNDTADGARKEFESCADADQDRSVPTAVRCANGAIKDFLWTINWSPTSKEFVCVVHDITELKQIERLKQAFFSMVSHDLRTPLAAMNVNIANISSGACGEVPEAGKRLVENAASSMSRLTALVNDLLELDKLDSGKLQLELDCISLRDVCKASLDSLEAMANNAEVKLLAPGNDAAVFADERRLGQAVNNLISNAIKFSPKHSEIRVQIKRQGKFAEIAVKDEGPGIAADQQAALFDRYVQGSAISNVSIKSSGLGLAIATSIVKAHGGEIGVDSEPGKGSTFWIRLEEFIDEDETS
jgi:PAS domain S-box-containing protein